ncbi:MAG TPA: SMP-30/gluconolactonase/LRE family protein [Sphingomonas sp.]|nr:SMP-30/gluconolactonase/LRE family protein [Sphingomonas sp.]
MTAIRFLGDVRNRLGESPLWDPARGWLWWVDGVAGRIAAATPDGTLQRDWTFDEPIGSIALGPDGTLVAAMANRFVALSDDGAPTALAVVTLADGLRFNDGKADRNGRFLSGTIQRGAATGGLWRIDRDATATEIEDGLRIANAISFSPDGDTLYLADSLEGGIRRYAYDPATGAIGSRDWLIDPDTLGDPADGATVDREGRLWVALVTAQAIACVSPDGRVLDRIATPIPYPSCPAFGGVDLTTLYVTTISDSGHRLRTDHPDAGRILAIDGLGATGIAERPWNHKRD